MPRAGSPLMEGCMLAAGGGAKGCGVTGARGWVTAQCWLLLRMGSPLHSSPDPPTHGCLDLIRTQSQ